jgi:hypothetical protein
VSLHRRPQSASAMYSIAPVRATHHTREMRNSQVFSLMIRHLTAQMEGWKLTSGTGVKTGLFLIPFTVKRAVRLHPVPRRPTFIRRERANDER